MLLSGGLDSSILLHFLLKRGERICAIHFNFGQSNYLSEIKAARASWKSIPGDKQPLIEIDITNWRCQFKNALPQNRIEMGTLPRNAILSLLALPYAQLNQCRWIAVGSTTEDSGMPDSDDFFVESINRLLSQTRQQEKVATPWLWHESGWGKFEIVQWGLKNIGLEFLQTTYSCYRKDPCGECSACKSRNKVFGQLGIQETKDVDLRSQGASKSKSK